MKNLFVFSILILKTISRDCNTYNPVCGSNGVTYQNSCKCREAKVDIGYHGACIGTSEFEWVVNSKDEERKNVFGWKAEEKNEGEN